MVRSVMKGRLAASLTGQRKLVHRLFRYGTASAGCRFLSLRAYHVYPLATLLRVTSNLISSSLHPPAYTEYVPTIASAGRPSNDSMQPQTPIRMV